MEGYIEEFTLSQEQLKIKKSLGRLLNKADKAGLKLRVFDGSVFLEPEFSDNQQYGGDCINYLIAIDADVETRIDADGGAGV